MNDENNNIEHKRGRPKGSLDKVTRKRRTDHDLKVLPGDNSKIINHNMLLMSQPRVNTNDRKQIEDRIIWYFETCMKNDVRPGVAGLCLALGITRQCWQVWGSGAYRDYKDLVERTRSVMESILEQYSLQGKINPVTAIFFFKNHFGYKDQSEMVLTPNNPLGDNVDSEVLRHKYLDNVYGVSEETEDREEGE